MEVSRFRVLFLSLLAVTVLPGCSMMGGRDDDRPEAVAPAANAQPVTGEPDQRPIIDPQVERREIRRARIDTEDFELGAYVGVLSIEDFESNVVYGARLAYHLTEDFFLEGTLGQSRAGRTSYENLSGSADLLDDDDRDYTYYALSMGWNALPGEIFVGKNRAYNSAFYLIAGIGSTTFAGDDRFTVNGGFGYRVLPADWIAVHFDVRDHIYDIDILGEKKIVNNLEAHLGLSIFF
ncbi:outer membrane beta-barrel domain-containing protein [Steroidobacter sp. S1-65]|uniref:Outer membrane beta-barrel domain-containing protein n=1 Tax=Steroidobacter gossypii TaxID=2805490 RepID=A0ABS1X2F0_9GAMM|nr:outer membrane beta-barrel domain-containing protein [Steroidobacter gossypii]MBM0107408.1 outer membrane beta-barrel domain-containing protein [Steroidobacter gossypii]